MSENKSNSIKKDMRRLSGVSVLFVVGITCFMFFSPFSTQFNDTNISRGSSWEMDINEFVNSNQTDKALNYTDSMIEVKSMDLPRIAYFDRYLSEDERIDVVNARADIYDLQWKRIEILKLTNQTDVLRDALEEYSKIIGYNQDSAINMLKQLGYK